jgi:hypothetical protein
MIPNVRALQTWCRDVSEKKIGILSGSVLKYLCPDLYIISLGGVTSPHFRDCRNNLAMKIKKLGQVPELQFGTLLNNKGGDKNLYPMASAVRTLQLCGPYEAKFRIYEMDWEALKRGGNPLQAGLLNSIPVPHAMVDHLDIANVSDERRTDFEVFSTYPYTDSLPVLTHGTLGGAYFTLSTIPGKDIWLVLRLSVKEKVLFRRLGGTCRRTLDMEYLENLRLKINGSRQIAVELNITEADKQNNFVEKVVPIPKEYINGEKTDFSLIGEYLLCDVWLYAGQSD